MSEQKDPSQEPQQSGLTIQPIVKAPGKSEAASLLDGDMRYYAVCLVYRMRPDEDKPHYCLWFVTHSAEGYRNERQLAIDIASMCVRFFEKRIAPRLTTIDTPRGYPDIIGEQNCVTLDAGDFLEFYKVAIHQQNRWGPDRYPVHIVGHPQNPMAFTAYKSDVYSDFKSLMGSLEAWETRPDDKEAQPLIFHGE